MVKKFSLALVIASVGFAVAALPSVAETVNRVPDVDSKGGDNPVVRKGGDNPIVKKGGDNPIVKEEEVGEAAAAPDDAANPSKGGDNPITGKEHDDSRPKH